MVCLEPSRRAGTRAATPAKMSDGNRSLMARLDRRNLERDLRLVAATPARSQTRRKPKPYARRSAPPTVRLDASPKTPLHAVPPTAVAPFRQKTLAPAESSSLCWSP